MVCLFAAGLYGLTALSHVADALPPGDKRVQALHARSSLTQDSANTTSSGAAQSSTSASPATCTAAGVEYKDKQKYTDANNITYVVHCGEDNSQNSYSTVQVFKGGFAKCFAACDQDGECAGFTYSGADSGDCYLKSSEGTYSEAASNIVSAFCLADGTSKSPSSAGPSGQPSTSTGSSQPSKTSAATSGRSCSQLAAQKATYSDVNGVVYQVTCAYDLNDNDISGASAASFEDCFAICDKTSGCAAFTYLGGSGAGNCYLKSKAVGGAPSSGGADAAVRISGSSGQSSGTASTSAASTGVASHATTSNTTASASSTSASSTSTSSTSISSTSTSSCAGIAAQGTLYTDSNNRTYEVTCGYDYAGNDLIAKGGSYKDCFSYCDQTSGCAAFSFVGSDTSGTCYLKSVGANTVSSSSVSAARLLGGGSSSATASQTSSQASSAVSAAISSTSAASLTDCEYIAPYGAANYTDPAGVQYTVSCKHNIAGADLASSSAADFQACFAICDQNSQCVAFSWLQDEGPGNCYLKSAISGSPSTSNADVAYIVSRKGTNVTAPSTSSQVSSGASTSLVASSSSPSSTAVPSGACAYLSNSGSIYDGYQLECKTDHYGGDLSTQGVTSFQQCFPVCDALKGCVGFAYTGGSGAGTCYFKSYFTTATSNANVDFAGKPSAYLGYNSTTTSSPSSSAAGTSTVSSAASGGSSSFTPIVTATSTSRLNQSMPATSSSGPTSVKAMDTTTATRYQSSPAMTTETETVSQSLKLSITTVTHYTSSGSPTVVTKTETVSPSSKPAITTVTKYTSSSSIPVVTKTETVSSKPSITTITQYPSASSSAMATKTETVSSKLATTTVSVYTSSSSPIVVTKTETFSPSSKPAVTTVTEKYTSRPTTTITTSSSTQKPVSTSQSPQTTFETSKRTSSAVVTTTVTKITSASRTSSTTGTVVPYSKTTGMATATKSIVNPTPCAGQQQCDDVKGQTPFKLQCSVISGNMGFDGMYLAAPSYDSAFSVPSFQTSFSGAASMYYNPSSSYIAAGHGDCKFSGLSMVQKDGPDPYGGCVFSQSYSSSQVNMGRDNRISWDNDRFGSWLVCSTGSANELKYYDTVSGDDVDYAQCAKVHLSAVW